MHGSASTMRIGDGTAGASNVALKLVSGMTYTLGNATSSAVVFLSTAAGTQTVDTAGKTMGNMQFSGTAGVGSTWQFTSSVTQGATCSMTFDAGTLLTNNQTLTIGQFSSNNENTRALTLGSSSITLQAASASWNIGTSTNLTLDAGTSTITQSGLNSIFVHAGGATYNDLVITGVGTGQINSPCTFNNLTRTGTAVQTDQMRLSADITVTGALAINGNSVTNRLLVQATTVGNTATITANGTLSTSHTDWQDITGAGSVSWDLSAITGLSGDCGGNSGITFTTAQTNYWVGNGGSWTDGSHWASSSGGSASSGRVPLPQDPVRIDASSVTSGSQTITIDVPRFGADLDMTGVFNTPNLTMTMTANTTGYGSLTLVSAMTRTSWSSGLTLSGRGSHVITTAGIGMPGTVITAPNGTYTLADAYTASGTLSITNGTFNADSFNVTANAVTSTPSNTRGLALGSGTWSLTSTGTVWNVSAVASLTLTSDGAILDVTSTSATARTVIMSGSGTVAKDYGDTTLRYTANTAAQLTITGVFTAAALVISGNAKPIRQTINHTITLTSAAGFQVAGTAGSLIDWQSTSAGTASTISVASGTVSTDYISLKDSAATGGARFFAGANSTNVSGNSGWVFSAPVRNLSFPLDSPIRPRFFAPGIAR